MLKPGRIAFLLLYVFSGSAICGCFASGDYVIQIGPEAEFTEELAIRVSRQALRLNGKNVAEMIPVRYTVNENVREKYFARNVLDHTKGYVLWGRKGSQALYEYSVRMKRHGDKVFCRVISVK